MQTDASMAKRSVHALVLRCVIVKSTGDGQPPEPLRAYRRNPDNGKLDETGCTAGRMYLQPRCTEGNAMARGEDSTLCCVT